MHFEGCGAHISVMVFLKQKFAKKGAAKMKTFKRGYENAVDNSTAELGTPWIG